MSRSAKLYGVWLDRICLANAVTVAEPVCAIGPVSHDLRKGPQTVNVIGGLAFQDSGFFQSREALLMLLSGHVLILLVSTTEHACWQCNADFDVSP